MTRKEKIEAIYKEIANKEVSFGCKVKFSKGVYKIIDRENIGFLSSYEAKDGVVHNTIVIEDGINSRCYNIEKIIGHPVMIGDVLGWLDRKICLLLDQGKEVEKLLKGSDALNLRLINVWKHKIKPLDEQPDYCIDYVTNILDKFGSVI